MRKKALGVVPSPGVFVTQGAHRTLFVNVAKGTFIRLNNNHVDDRGRIESSSAVFVERLLETGFFSKWFIGCEMQPTRYESGVSRVGCASTIVLDCAGLDLKKIYDVVSEAAIFAKTKHFIYLNFSGVVLDLVGISKACNVSFEIGAINGEGSIESEIYSVLGFKVGRRSVRKRVLLRDQLEVGAHAIAMQQLYVESYGTLFIDRRLNVFPLHTEKVFRISSLIDESWQEILSGVKFKIYSSNSKMHRNVCKFCEFRLVCMYSFTRRADCSDIASAPKDCLYNPLKSQSQSEVI